METPVKGRNGGASRCPASEDSPVFNFIKNLSPIVADQPDVSGHSLQLFQSLDPASISSIFTSPQINSQNGPRQSSPSAVSYSEALSGDKSSPSAVTSPAGESNITCSLNKAAADDVLEESLNPVNSPKENVSSPECYHLSSGGTKEDLGFDAGLRGVTEMGNCDWENTFTAELLPPDSGVADVPRESGVFDGSIQNVLQDFQVDWAKIAAMCDEMDCGPQMIPGGFQSQLVSSEQVYRQTDGLSDVNILNCKVDPANQVQQPVHRRCLVFEPGDSASTRGLQKDPSSNNTSLAAKRKTKSSHHRCPKPANSPASALRGIGLHLNALAVCSHDGSLSHDVSEKPLAVVLPHPQPFLSIEYPVEDTTTVQDDSLALVPYGVEETSQESPKKKRRRLDSSDDACKRCSCKKSKCLKLYCECFAAGVYCSEPCACRGCQNKPIHEEIVLSTRKQIESRNPLAFAPKVIRAYTDTDLEHAEDSNNTPASARHKRGCNCKKSNCLKRYCECYQEGVGCSVNCRCESCGNTFGTRDGGDAPLGGDADEIEAKPICAIAADNDVLQLLEPSPITPSFPGLGQLAKFSFMASKPRSAGKPARCSSRLSASEDDTPKYCRDEFPCVEVKNASPNCKRVSPPKCVSHGASPICKAGRKLILKSISPFPALSAADDNDNDSKSGLLLPL